MGLRLYNTLTGQKEDFSPFDAKNVRMYVCGPTVYDFAHIGNARPVIVFDVLFRLLRHLYGEEHVTYVRNITDVDDKINKRAAEEYPDLPLNDAIRKVTETTEKQFHDDVAALGCLPPTHEPRATEFISRNDASEDMVRLIGRLIENGHAYAAEGHVLFDVPSFPDYGKLAHRSLDEMIAGARVEVAPYKRDPMDFVLWKPSTPGEPAWSSPWGMGRPGWHIECSAMAGALLGETFDIHGGGIDLVFPHHENEIAQSRGAHGTPLMARHWMHNGFLQVEGEKMSKSLGNFVTIREARQRWDGPVLRFNMLRTHYREPINWTENNLAQSNNELLGLEATALDHVESDVDEAFIEALSDDLNTSLARARLFDLKNQAAHGNPSAGRRLRWSLQFLGFGGAISDWQSTLRDSIALFAQGFPADSQGAFAELVHSLPAELSWGSVKREFRSSVDGNQLHIQALPSGFVELVDSISDSSMVGDIRTIPEKQLPEIVSMKRERAVARGARNFAEADRIRGQLESMGVLLKDSKDPKTGKLVTTWEVKR